MSAVALNVVEAGPRQDLISYLEKLLEDAKSGELQGIAVACEWKDGGVGEGWALTRNQNYRMLGCIEMLRHKIASMMES